MLLDQVQETFETQPETVLGFRRFSLRGLAQVRGEWDLVCLAVNAKRLHALMAA